MKLNILDLLDQAEEGYLIPCRKGRGRVDLFAKSYCGDTMLHVAVGRHQLDEVKYLVEQGLDVNTRGDYLATPLYNAAMGKDVSMIKLLLKLGADENIPDHRGVLPKDIFHGEWPPSDQGK